MNADELRRLLNEGIAATRRGDHARGRDLLLQVVAADDRMEPAWLWLGTALESPADQLVALENVLTLNPRHPQALAGVAALRAQLGVTPPAPPPPAPPPPAEAASASSAAESEWQPAAPPPAVRPSPPLAAPSFTLDPAAFEDDPYQCAYCGRPTAEAATRCPHCGRDLLMPGFWRGGLYQYFLLIILGLQVQAAVLEATLAFLQEQAPQMLAALPFIGPAITTLIVPAALRFVVWGLMLMVLLNDSRRGYGLLVGLAVLDGLWMAVAYQSGWISALLVIINVSLGGIIGLLGLAALVSQAQARVRRRTVLQRGLQSAPQMHEHAQIYAGQGLWALAALHWRRAIGKDPRNLAYYKGLGKAQVALKQYAQAVKTFRSGVELAPDDQEFQRLIESVRSHVRSS